ncbi:MAG: hypothetical protein IH991_13850 [Planctomycetes bacterium]|nr:hypothetical protein [Planctomycetota bacterium]
MRLFRQFWSLAVVAICVELILARTAVSQETTSAKQLWDTFIENLQSPATCEIEARMYGSRLDRRFVTNQHRYRRSGDIIRWDQLIRTLRPQGVVSETLFQIYFDGNQTITLTANLAGLPRRISPRQPRGVRCSMEPGLSQRLNDGLVLEVLWLSPSTGGGERLSLVQIPSVATSGTVIDEGVPTVRYVLPDLSQGDKTYTNRHVEIDFDRNHAGWISHVRSRYVSSKNGEEMKVGTRIREFHDLGNGRFFPKVLTWYTLDPNGTEKPGPKTEVTLCRINEPVEESQLVLDKPVGLPIAVETKREGDLRMHRLQVNSSTGESKEFQGHDQFIQFAETTKGQEEWTGSYTPPSYFDYHFKDKEQAKALLQDIQESHKTAGPDNVSRIRTGNDANREEAAYGSGATSYLMWGGVGILAVIGFFAIQHLARSRKKKTLGQSIL